MAISYFCEHCGAENPPGARQCRACQQLLDLPAGGVQGGALLHGRYEILTEIGAGGFGAVYKARDTQEDGRLVAVKQINLQGLSAQEIIEATDAFNREADILSTLRHPMLPRIFDRFSDPHHWYLVMSLIEGQTLEDYLQRKLAAAPATRPGLALEETLTIGLQVCDVLHYLHRQQPPVIFRDLKPGNLMRTASGRLYLIDFGIARRFKPGQIKDTIPFGSPGFAAPEQYGKAQTTPQADLYSLGALLYTLISGDDPSEHPFQFPPLRVYGTDGIRELGDLIQRLVSLAPEHRPATIEEVRAELQRIQHLHALASRQGHLWVPPQGQTPPPFPAVGSRQQQIFLTPSSQQRPARKTSRRRVLTAGLIAGGVLAVGTIALNLQSQQQSRWITNANETQVASDEQTNAADAQNMEQTAVAQSEEATAIASSQVQGAPPNGPTFWSPDLSHAAVANLIEGQIEIYRVPGQHPLETISMPGSFFNTTIQWSADNTTIAAQADNGMIYAWNAKNGQLLFRFAGAQSGYGPTSLAILSWSPDGEYCAIGYANDTTIDFTGNYLNTSLTILQASTGNIYFQTSFPGYNSKSNGILGWSPNSRYLAFPESFGWQANSSWVFDVWDRQTNHLIRSFSGNQSSNYFNSILSIVWSPSGKKLATVIDSSLWINQFSDNKPAQMLVDISGDITYGPVWSPDETYVALLTDQSSLAIYKLPTGEASYLNTTDIFDTFIAFAFSANGQSILTVDNNNLISHWSLG
jgi:serine/threonine protein kinase